MPALGMSGLWASGLGFPRPPCQRISPLSDHQERAAVPPLFLRRRSLAFLCTPFTPGEILLNVWRQSYDIPCSPTFLPPSLPFKLPLPAPASSLTVSITSFSLLQPRVDEPQRCFFFLSLSLPFFFLRKEEGLC